jgi:RNA recognition motif-containing protein
MSIIIRLQNLPLEANSLDIRRFFQGLQIPDGGVHIVGGENGDAFIAFASDEDARQAMDRNGDNIKDCRIKLLLSSRNEMQRVIDLARNQTLGIKPIETNSSSNASNYLNSGLLPLPNNSPNNIKPNINLHRNSRSPDRRQVRSRSIERENRMRNRSRSRSPFRNDRNKSLNGNNDNIINRMVSMHSGIMNTLRDVPNQNLYSQQNPSVRSRVGYSDAILASGLQDRNQWQPRNDSSVQTREITASGDFDRELELFRDNRLVHNNREINLNERSYTVELRNLPFNIVVRDIIDFFNGLFVPEENIKILIDDRGLTTGGALVRFNNERDFDAALSMNKRFLCDRRIDVQPLLENFAHERNDVIPYPPQSLQNTLDINPNMINRRSEHDLVLYMKGLPYSNCTERDVAKFFEPIRLKNIVIDCDPKGKPTGNAFVEFDNINDYESGLQLNMKHMGRRYIELLPTNKDDMIDARRGLPLPIVAETPKTSFCVNITGLPATVQNRDLTNYFSEAGAQPYAIHIMLRPNGFNAGEAYVEFASIEHQYCALRRDGDFMGNSRISVKSVPFEVMRDIVGKPPPVQALEPLPRTLLPPQSRQLRAGRHDDHMRPQHRRDREDRRRGDLFADGRCVVIATNIPYKASTEDICVFFSDFGITEECVARRFNEKGQPTADAKIAFHNPDDAIRAVRQMHKKFLIGRPVFLRPAT